ncbi:MAG: hypothetical protein A2Y58_06055 [Chloroflexi bacterium RBG_13_51_52]|nr:MAG: hypothetical protein A2Y58_06055 [Chloroflexi bacterium RBG_13_51_52]
METFAGKSGKLSSDQAIAGAVTQKKDNKQETAEFKDNRAVSSQAGLQFMIGDSPRVAGQRKSTHQIKENQIQSRENETRMESTQLVQRKNNVSKHIIQRSPLPGGHPDFDYLYRNLRFILAEIMDIRENGEPASKRGELFLGMNYKRRAEMVFRDIWAEADDFRQLGGWLLGEMERIVGNDEKREGYFRTRIHSLVTRGEKAAMKGIGTSSLEESGLESMELGLPVFKRRSGKEPLELGEKEEEEVKTGVQIPPWIFSLEDKAVRAARIGGSGACAYYLCDFLPERHEARLAVGAEQLLYHSRYFNTTTWEGRVRRISELIAMAAQNTGATEVQIVDKVHGAMSIEEGDVAVVKGLGRKTPVKTMSMSTFTTAREVYTFIMKYIGY